jgi:hypothetical protein
MPNPDVTVEIGHVGAIQVPVTVENRGTASLSRDVRLEVNGSVVDSQSVSLGVGASTTVTLSDSSFGQADIGTVRQYEVVTGGVEPDIDAQIFGVLAVPAGTVVEVPSFEPTEIRFEQTGELHFDQTDAIELTQ